MRRTRAIAIVGLVLGLSGCAGTHQHQHFPATGPVPARPTGLVRAGCACHGALASRPGPLVPTLATRPNLPALATASRSLPPAQPPSGSLPPPSSRPVAVPAPGGVVRYFPLFEGDVARSVWDTVTPDLLGVRTSMAPARTPDLGTAPAAAAEDSPGPLSPDAGTLSLSSPELNNLPQGNPPASVPPGQPVTMSGAREARGDVIPVSAVITTLPAALTGQLPPAGALDVPLPGPDLAVGDATAQPPKTLALEHAENPALAGRPRWQPQAQVPLVQDQHRDQAGPSTWVSELAFRRPAPPAGADSERVPMARSEGQAAGPKRTNVVSRFLRRVRVAGQAFIDPDSVRREAGHLPQGGQGVERASTYRLGESPQR